MRRSRIISPVHFVWATRQRQPFLSEDIERAVHRRICREAERLRCCVLAIGGMPDHVHLAVLFCATVSYSQFMQQVKGASSRGTSESGILPPNVQFGWQDGYGAFGFSRREIPAVAAYIRNQKCRHSKDKLWPDLEETHEEIPDPPGM